MFGSCAVLPCFASAHAAAITFSVAFFPAEFNFAGGCFTVSLLKPSFEALTYVLRGEAFGTSVVCQKTQLSTKFEILQFLGTFCCPKFVTWRDTRKISASTVGAQGRKMHGTFIKDCDKQKCQI